MTENVHKAIAKSTLYRSLGALADQYPLPDVVETLAQIAQERKLGKTAEALDKAVDIALDEVEA